MRLNEANLRRTFKILVLKNEYLRMVGKSMIETCLKLTSDKLPAFFHVRGHEKDSKDHNIID
jgi:hypothetical protein